MSLTMSYKVTGLKVRDQVNSDGDSLTDAVVQTYWEATGVDANGNEGKFPGATPFTAEQVPAGEFTAFADLTEEIVLGWITDYIDSMPGYMDSIQERIIKGIEDTTKVVQEKAMPWDPDAPSLEAPVPEEPVEDAVDPAADPDAP